MSDVPSKPPAQADSQTTPPANDQPDKPQPTGCLTLLRKIISVGCALVIILCMVGVVASRMGAETIGFDLANVATFLLTFLALLLFMLLILLRTNIGLFARLLAVGFIILVICIPIFTLRVDGFDGRLVPILRWRWTPEPGPLVALPGEATDKDSIDLTTRTGDDFPQFLGPQRTPYLPQVQLAEDWAERPPELLWRTRIGAGWSGFAAVNGYAVTMEQRDTNEVISCYSIKDGAAVWAHPYAARHTTVMGGLGPRSTPTIDDGRVYTLGATGILCCVDGANGSLIWSDDLRKRCGVTGPEDLAAISWGRSASPLIVNDLVVIPLGGPLEGPKHSLAAFDKVTGELRWLGGAQQVSYASPTLETLCGIEQIVIVNESSVTGHRLEDGEPLWDYELEARSNAEANCSQAVVLPNDQVLLTNRKMAELLQLSPAPDGRLEAESVWVGRNKLKTKFTNVVVYDQHIYGLSDGLLECLELETGKRCWKSRKGDYGHGQILGVGDVLLVQAESGEVVMVEFNSDKLVELGRLEALSERTWNTLCLYGSLLLVRNASEAACYRLPLRGPAE